VAGGLGWVGGGSAGAGGTPGSVVGGCRSDAAAARAGVVGPVPREWPQAANANTNVTTTCESVTFEPRINSVTFNARTTYTSCSRPVGFGARRV
jgi:hypothetical protein